jgi:hypothetical protein
MAGISPERATDRPARSAERSEPQARRRLKRFGEFALAIAGVEDDPRVEGLGLDAAVRMGGTGRVAIVELDPLEEGHARCGRNGRAFAARHDQPLVPTARRYSVTWAVPDTPASTISALRIAG